MAKITKHEDHYRVEHFDHHKGGTLVFSVPEYSELVRAIIETENLEYVGVAEDGQDTADVTPMDEAARIINGQRRDDYGPVEESFQRIADLWSPVLGIDVTPEQVAMAMLQLKVSRWLHGQQRDSIVDIHGYAELAHRIVTERQEHS